MKKIRLLIVDDELLAHKLLEGYCQQIDYVEVVGNCYDGISTLNFLNEHTVDALLLDIQMPNLTGFELLESLKTQVPKVIFTTAYTEHALKGFDYDQVIDYLNKPIRFVRFVKAIERLKKQLMLEQKFSVSESVESSPISTDNTHEEYLYIKDNKVIYKVSLGNILYFQSWGNYLKVFMTNNEVKVYRKTLKEIIAEVPAQQFQRIHKSYLVNTDKIKALQGNMLLLEEERELPVGRAYQLQVRTRVMGK
ncbi:hypothetical protein BKI52_04110 [marine bacterium AO1-C]|nr:hypothetical protein BKI52_04110 [marine bacterium AO1-C]